VRQYQTALDSVLGANSELRKYVAHCTNCEIRFLTHPRNAGRVNLRCPFGCRDHHRRSRSNQRSSAYYRTSAGKAKKRRLNANRRGPSHRAEAEKAIEPSSVPIRESNGSDAATLDAPRTGIPSPEELNPVVRPSNEPPFHALSASIEIRIGGVVLDTVTLSNSRLLSYVRMLAQLIDGVDLSRDQMIDVLRHAMRQHSIANRRSVDYVLGFLHRHPP